METNQQMRQMAAELVTAMTANLGEANFIREGQMDEHVAVRMIRSAWYEGAASQLLGNSEQLSTTPTS